MDFAFSEEQDMLRAAAAEWLAERYPLDRVAGLADGAEGWDAGVWKELTGLGWLDPDLGMLEYAVLAEEAGYAVLPAPWWSAVALAAPILGSPPDVPTTLAWAEPDAPGLGDPPRATATARDSEWVLTGRKVRVPDLGLAERVLVTAMAPDGPGIYAVAAADLTARPMVTVDGTRRLGELTLAADPAHEVVAAGSAGPALTAVRRRATALLACEAVGIMQRALDLATAQAKERTQFGRPIGSYQAVSHPIADVYAALSMGRSLAYRAAWAVDTEADDVEQALHVAALAAGAGAVRACECAIQVMGGVGFTWEHPLHRLYKRAQWIAAFEGTPQSRRAAIAATLLE